MPNTTSLIHSGNNSDPVIFEHRNRSGGSVVWRRYGEGYRIESLTEEHYADALNLLKEYYIPNDYVCGSLKIHTDQESTESFLQRALFHMEANNSLIVIDERVKYEIVQEDETAMVKCYVKDEVVGVLVARIIDKSQVFRTLSRPSLMNGAAHFNFVELKQTLCRPMEEYELMLCNSVLKLYYVCIQPTFRRREFTLKLMNAALESARRVNVDVVVALFGSRKLQQLAKSIGMKVIREIKYEDWNSLKAEDMFPSRTESAYMLMAGCIEPEPLPEVTAKPSDEDGKQKKGKKKKDKGSKKGGSKKKK